MKDCFEMNQSFIFPLYCEKWFGYWVYCGVGQ